MDTAGSGRSSQVRAAKAALKTELESLIVGKQYRGIVCPCGHVTGRDFHAVGVLGGGATTVSWAVMLAADARDGRAVWRFAVPLEAFLPETQLKELFTRNYAAL